MTTRVLCIALLALLSASAVASAQVPGYEHRQFRIEQFDANHVRLTGQVELENQDVKGQKFYADVVDVFLDTHRLEASGHVLYETATARIAAERVIFNTRASTGTFYTASGSAGIGTRADKSLFGSLEPDVYFFGEIVEKIGEDKYKVTNGRFTTCVQPTPRWEVAAGSITINVGDYALLKNAVMQVKDVPIFYLPILYYPIQEDGRSTGFLLPTYGRSTFQGQSISNAFFWAISRSQDLTVMHDWFTQTGYGYGSEYRWVRSGTSNGNLRAYRLNQKAATVSGASIPASESFLMNGSASQSFPFRLTGRARVDYSSRLQLNQLYSRDLFSATQGVSTVTGNISGSWQFVSASLGATRSEQFFNDTQSLITGNLPSLIASVSSRKLGPLPVFFALQSEASRQLYINKTGPVEDDSGLSKVDVTPTLRAPISNWPFLNATLNLSYRVTRFSESVDENNQNVDVPYLRHYGELRADITGPTFSRVYTPNNAVADRLKHVIEPTFSVQRTTDIPGTNRVRLLGSSFDRVIGNTTRMTYGLTNRVLVRKAPKEGSGSAPSATAPRELLTASITQSYYSNQQASAFDPSYSGSYAGTGSVRKPSNFSPVAANVRSQVAQHVGGTMRLEYDWPTQKLLTMSTGADYNTPAANVNVSWSRSLSAFFPTNALNGNTRVNLFQGKITGSYQIAWDIQRDTIIRQGVVASYNAQCCGFLVEYQEYNFGGSSSGLPTDRRFNFGFTLAGLGTFSNFFGNFGGGRY